jgi:hypothetical protein
MRTSHLIVFAVSVFTSAYACRSHKTIDVMKMAAVCDSTQASPDPSERGPRLPSLVPSERFATLIGTMEEAVSKHPLRGGTVDLTPTDSANRPPGVRLSVPADSLGGFAIDSVPPGEYVIRARRIGFDKIERTAVLDVGRVDTARFTMRRYSCVGY